MKRCPKCAEKIQNQARICRYCGSEQPQNEGGKGTLLLVIGGILLVGTLAKSLNGGAEETYPEKSPATASASAVTTSRTAKASVSNRTNTPYSDFNRQHAWIERGKEQIRTRLKDPASAQFRNVHFYSGGGVPVTCGEVNSRNSFGGYTGFERFIAAGSQLAVVESDMTTPSELDQVWDKFCSKRSTDGA